MSRLKKMRLGLLLLLVMLLLAGCQKSSGKTVNITLEIRCDTAIDQGLLEEEKWQGVLPEDGVVFEKQTVTVPEGSTAFDALIQVRDQNKIHVDYSGTKGSEYVKGIGNLYEFDGGRWSGWMFSVNGEYPKVGCGKYTVEEGDEIFFAYTCDLGVDLDSDMEGAEEWKESHE